MHEWNPRLRDNHSMKVMVRNMKLVLTKYDPSNSLEDQTYGKSVKRLMVALGLAYLLS